MIAIKHDFEILDDGSVRIPFRTASGEDLDCLVSFASLIRLRDWRYSWYVARQHGVDYVVSNVNNNKIVYLHRYLLDAGAGTEILFLNGNTLDCRLNNLVKLTHSQRQMLKPATNKIGVRGVTVNNRGKFIAMPCKDRKNVYLGSYDRLPDAVSAVQQWRKQQLPQRLHHLI